MKTQNYTPAMTAQIVTNYQSGASVEQIAKSINKSVRSVRSKLVREGVYIAAEKPKAKGVKEATKKELLLELETVAPFPVDGLLGATKEAIKAMLKHYAE
jgi:hypothetical protein